MNKILLSILIVTGGFLVYGYAWLMYLCITQDKLGALLMINASTFALAAVWLACRKNIL
jgi:hypothetical protein